MSGKNNAITFMSIRAYFAAHAPTEPSAWFEPAMSSAKPEPEFDHDHSRCGGEDSNRMPWECLVTNHDLRAAWELEYYKQRLIQWPWAWSDAVLAAGGGDL